MSHPIQPLAPKHQAGARRNSLVNKSKYPLDNNYNKMTVKQELLQQERVEERIAQKLGKLHDTLSEQRQARRLKRQQSAGHVEEIIKSLQAVKVTAGRQRP